MPHAVKFTDVKTILEFRKIVINLYCQLVFGFKFIQ